jgi:hypothetical protein
MMVEIDKDINFGNCYNKQNAISVAPRAMDVALGKTVEASSKSEKGRRLEWELHDVLQDTI